MAARRTAAGWWDKGQHLWEASTGRQYGQQAALQPSGLFAFTHICLPNGFRLCRVGEVVAQRAREAGVDAVHWPRKHGQRYHGKIAAMIEALKAQGVKLI